MANTIDLKNRHEDFRTPGLRYSVSSRGISAEMTIEDYLRIYYLYVNISQIESVFGSACSPSRLYGGRSFNPESSLNDRHIQRLEEIGVGVSLTFTSHFFSEEAYEHSRELLDRLYRKNNSVICTNDDLARRIRRDYPDYTLRASIVKNIDTAEKIAENLELYDMVVLPMDKNDDDDLLQDIREKGRVLLFGNANCAYTCPARTCYYGFSQKNAGLKVTSTCSKDKTPRLDLGKVYFDVLKFKAMGFSHFKLVPLVPPGAREAALYFSLKRKGDA